MKSIGPVSYRLNTAVTTITRILMPHGFDQSACAPNTWPALKAEHAKTGRIHVSNEACDNTIFGDHAVNVQFRAWHDWCHLYLGADFSLLGEAAAATLQSTQLLTLFGDDYGKVAFELDLLDADINGQRAYYDMHKQYVTDQRAFSMAYVCSGRESALSKIWH